MALLFTGCSVQESTRSGGLVAPTGPTVTAASPAPTITTVPAEPTSEPPASASEPAESAPRSAASVPRSAETTAGQSSESTAAPMVATDAPATTAPETLPPPTEPDPAAGARAVLAAADPPEGFGEGVLGVTAPAGPRVWPVIVADTPQSRQRGLMGVTDFAALGGYAAMVFIFDGDTSGAFWMRNTPLPLRITFVSASGSVVSATDMVPCLAPTPSDECKHYHPEGPYRIAVEHPLSPAFDIGLDTAEFVEVTVE